MPAFVPNRPAREAHASLLRALADQERSSHEVALWFADIVQRRLYLEFGDSSIWQYAERRLGFSRSKTGHLLQVVTSMHRLPGLRDSLEKGELTWTKARVVARVATEETVEEWVSTARSRSRRELERRAKSARTRSRSAVAAQGDLLEPASREEPPSPTPQTVSFVMTPEEYARFEAGMERIRKRGRGDSKVAVLLAALEAEESTRVDSGPSARLVVTTCPACASVSLPTSRGDLSVDDATARRLRCDAVIESEDGSRRSTIPPRRRREVLRRDGYRCTSPGCGSARFLEVHHVVPRARGGGHELDNLVTLCSGCHQAWHRRKEGGHRPGP
jgi:5-methylcytosine-specific restriction endonuclease McrA